MASHARILNITNGYRFKRTHAERAIDVCSAVWVEYGVSIRNLTLAESIAARNDQASRREPLPFAEIPGIKYEPCTSGISATGREGRLLWEAHDWVIGRFYEPA
jgi:hypothetical protein